jgi:diguanylate cyclase
LFRQGTELVPNSTTVFLLGLAVGSLLLILGIVLGYWFGRKSAGVVTPDPLQGQQFLAFLRTMSQWTSEFSGDINKYQDQLSSINKKVQSGNAPREELQRMVGDMMETNRSLQLRLENTEKKLETQTGQLASYLKEARTDGLTGLPNRKSFDKAIDDLYNQWQKQQQAFCIGLIDIDHFKRINDTYGHPAGDAVLKHLAQTLQSELAEVICVARYGGEEFGILMLSTLEESANLLDRLRAAVSKIQVEHDGKFIDITLSGGMAQILPGERIGQLVRRSDEALYASKLGGRNRIHLHDGSLCRLVTKVVSGPAAGSEAQGNPTAGSHDEALDEINRIQERLHRIVKEESQRLAQR